MEENYERLVSSAEGGNVRAKWMVRKIDTFEILEAFEKFKNLDDASFDEFVSSFVEVVANEDSESVLRYLTGLSDRFKEFASSYMLKIAK